MDPTTIPHSRYFLLLGCLPSDLKIRSFTTSAATLEDAQTQFTDSLYRSDATLRAQNLEKHGCLVRFEWVYSSETKIKAEVINLYRLAPSVEMKQELKPSVLSLWQKAFASFREAADATKVGGLTGGGFDRAARMWADFDRIVDYLSQGKVEHEEMATPAT